MWNFRGSIDVDIEFEVDSKSTETSTYKWDIGPVWCSLKLVHLVQIGVESSWLGLHTTYSPFYRGAPSNQGLYVQWYLCIKVDHLNELLLDWQCNNVAQAFHLDLSKLKCEYVSQWLRNVTSLDLFHYNGNNRKYNNKNMIRYSIHLCIYITFLTTRDLMVHSSFN